jgi:hypothetical protein
MTRPGCRCLLDWDVWGGCVRRRWWWSEAIWAIYSLNIYSYSYMGLLCEKEVVVEWVVEAGRWRSERGC